MHKAAELFLALDCAKKRAACIQLCERALRIWESTFPDGCSVAYRESVVGSIQTLDCGLPREALAAVRSGKDAAAIGQRYLEPIAALQDDDLVLPEAAHFAYYAVYNAFERYVSEKKIDEWTIVSQAIASAGSDDPGVTLSEVLRDIA